MKVPEQVVCVQGRCLVIANLASMTQTQLLELSRGSFWHAQMLRLCGAHVGRGVFLDSLGLMVCLFLLITIPFISCLFLFITIPYISCCLLAVLACPAMWCTVSM